MWLIAAMPGFRRSWTVIVSGILVVLFVFDYMLISSGILDSLNHFRVHASDKRSSVDMAAKTIQWQQWYKKRKELLSNSSVPRKVLLFCYMRGGSTIAGELFNRDPRAVLWYEPLAAYFTAYYGIDYITKPYMVLYESDRTPINYTEAEVTRLAEFYRKSFDCDLEELPAEVWLHKTITHSQNLNAIKKCIKTIGKDNMLIKYPSPAIVCGNIGKARTINCPEILESARQYFAEHSSSGKSTVPTRSDLESYLKSSTGIEMKDYKELVNHILTVDRLRNKCLRCMHLGAERCKSASLGVMETLRIRMSFLEPILLRNPDMYVIYYVRDPRGIITSRISGIAPSRDRSLVDIVVEEASLLCNTMKDDLDSMQRLKNTYPGVFLSMRYEDLILKPMDTADKVYRAIGFEYPGVSKWPDYVDEIFNSNNEDGRFGVRRKNASYHIDKWKTILKSKHLKIINGICHDVITELGYPI